MMHVSAVLRTSSIDPFAEAERRLREWGWQCGWGDDRQVCNLPYRDSRIKEMLDVGKAWKKNRDAHREREDRRRQAARKAAETRSARRANRVKICGTCGHIHYRECRRCAEDPRYTALGKQTRDFHPIEGGPARRISAAAAQIDQIVRSLPDEWATELLKRCYLDGNTPWRRHAWELRISWGGFKQQLEAAVEAVAERLATRTTAAV